jgi:magnesium transporter
MIRIFKDKITWLDAIRPSEQDIQTITEEFNLHPLIVDELRGLSGLGKAEFYSTYIFLIIHFPFYDEHRKTSRPVEIDVVAAKNKVATVRYEDFPPLEEFASKCETAPRFSDHCLGNTPAHFLYRLFEYLMEYAMRELKHIDEKVTIISDGIFGGNERAMIQELAHVKRDILDFSRIIHPMRGTLESLAVKGEKLYGSDLKLYFDDLLRDFSRVEDRIANYKDAVESLEATNQALVSSRIDEVMKVLSVIAFLLAPFTIVGTLFQINTLFTPIIGFRGDWWILFGLMTAGSGLLYVIFKKKGWI